MKSEVDKSYLIKRHHFGQMSSILIILVLITLILRNLEGIIKPLIVSMFFSLMLQPLVKVLHQRFKVPQLLGYLIVFILYVFVFYFSIKIIQTNIKNIITQFPVYEVKINAFLKYLNEQLHLMQGELTVKVIIKKIPEQTINSLLSSTATTVFDLVTFLMFMLVLTLFYLLELNNIDLRMIKAFGLNKSKKIRSVYLNITSSIKKYMLMKTLINLGAAAFSGIVMAVFGLDFFLMWILIIFLILWIPYIGSALSIGLPIIMSLLQFDAGYKIVIFSILIFSGIITFGNILEPKILGKQLNISPLLVLISMTFWAWLWGVVGVILSVPISVAIKIVCSNFENTKSMAILMSEAVEPEEAKTIVK